ncbi:dihydroxyacetone kinase subunit DhaL [Aminivibrio sp.]|jgi:dihydroxyacetone kinase-like protein|uniref:dihydroxyacetone kinase subunit DhaL n=1 Tax=Aminivibrio sp. TaxID=1872489 RepID=UPI001A4958F3|nr:dihydroxyacetone kinase subunit DhaL [Aminivibrio sp.]MBL3540433.1 dihydroxyacetone kinase subunit L [Aminivibrio sp.]
MTRAAFSNREGACIIKDLIRVIRENKAYLSEIDGAIGDGDHGVNMEKGFSMCLSRVDWETSDFSGAAKTLGRILLMEIGGSMGPIYGTFFSKLAKETQGKEKIGGEEFSAMMNSAMAGIVELGGAKQGDKTLLDTLIPAVNAFDRAFAEKKDFNAALLSMQEAAKIGWESTRDMVAKVGRASRLGERSRGVLDAGATSCYLLLDAMAESIRRILMEVP